MNRSIRLVDEAESDLREARVWYEARRAGLGDEFIEAVHTRLRAIIEHPKSFREVAYGVRGATVKRFPYRVLYVEQGECIVVLAVYHESRDPRGWESRRPE